MKKPEIPKNEDHRLQSLCSLNILDTIAEERFDRYTRIAKRHFGVSIALVSLIDSERQWFKSRQGLEATETPRDISFCGHAILQNGIFNIPNALEDERFADNPLVTGPPNIRFYAGAPLHAPDGQAIGTLCIIDDKPHAFTAEELTLLRDLANGVEEELSHRKSVAITNKHHIYPISLISLIVGSLLSVSLFFMVFQNEENQIKLQMQARVDQRSAALFTELETVADVMHGIAGLYAASDHVDSHEFVTFLANAFPNKKDIHSVVWIENLDQNELNNFYQLARKDGYRNFRLRGLDENNKLFNVAPQQNNNVIYHVSSRDHKHWLSSGLNLSTMPTYKALLQQAMASGELVASFNNMRSDKHSDKTLELFMPVYHVNKSLDKGLAKKRELRGFIGLLLSVGDTVEAAYRNYISDTGGLDLYIVNDDPRYKQEILYFHASRARTSAVDPLPIEEVQKGWFASHDLKFADTRWKVVLRPIPGQYDVSNAAAPWLTLGVGLLFTLMMAGYLNTVQRRKGIIEQQVKQRTDELNNSRERIRAVIDTVVDGIVTIDAMGIVQSFNPAAEKIFGYPADEVIDRNINMLMPAPYTKEHDGYLHHYLSTGEKKVIGIGREVKGKRKDGSIFPMELSVNEMKINEERMFTGIVRDISERKQGELELQTVTAIRQAILDGANYAIITTDTEGLIQTFNRAAEFMLGYSAEEIVGKQSPALWHDMQEIAMRAKTLSNELGTNIEPGFGVFTAKASLDMPDEHEWTFTHQDGSRFTVLLSITALRDVKGIINGFLGIASDITERKKVERMKSEFISTVSHELRTPLTSIRGALGLVLGKAADQLSPKILKMLEMANRNSERLTLLINDILDLEKIESGSLEFEFKQMELVSLAHRAIEDNEGYASKHDVSLALETDLDEIQIYGDEHRLLQVFANLISNAVKYSPAKGEVTISITPFGKGYRVSVKDQGTGIPEEFRSRIFQRFAQADSSDTREKGGTGLGLSITKAIVERHGGVINYASIINKGTDFYFDLPDSQATIAHEDNNNAIRVLVCEDNADVATILAEMLKSEGLVSDIAATGQAARNLLAQNLYRLLLLDLTLPDIDGLEFLKELRETTEYKDLPVIVVSGRAHEGRVQFNGDAVTVVDWIQKPIEPDRLTRALREALQRVERPHILHVEDDPDIVQITQTLLEDVADFTHVPSVNAARQQLESHVFDLVILDLNLADGSGVELIDQLKSHCPVVIFSAQVPCREITEQVTAALTKSTTSNDQLLDTIKQLLKG